LCRHYSDDPSRATVRMSLSYPTMADKSFAGFRPWRLNAPPGDECREGV
jgi:hypothetical protein